MASSVISVEHISKQYLLQHEGRTSENFREMLTRVAGSWRKTKLFPNRSELFWALKDISFEVEQGCCLGLIGRNGTGKSTLLKILSRVTAPTSGRAIVRGKTGSLLEVGTGFHGDLTGRENIFLNGSILGMRRSEIRKKFDDIVSFAEVERFLDTPVKHYSTGMYMRLAFSVAAHLDPEILIIDEVLAVGDHAFQQKCLGKMEDMTKKQGRTILFVSHKMDTIHTLCDRVLVFDKGRLDFDANPSEAIAHYLSKSSNQYAATYEARPDLPSIISVQLDPESLNNGSLRLTMTYESPFPFPNPVPGFVIYNAYHVPLISSNTRFHSARFNPLPAANGCCEAQINNLELHTGTYSISVWLGDHYQDYDMKSEALKFDYESPNKYLHLPDPIQIGSIDKPCQWTWQPK